MNVKIKMKKNKPPYARDIVYLVTSNIAHGLIEGGFAKLVNAENEITKEMKPSKKKKFYITK